MARCSICQEGGARFACPAKSAKICRFCCGRYQRGEIDCPDECQYLPKPSPLDDEREEARLLNSMTRDHLDMLQNIEFAIVDAWRHDARIDDAAAYESLRAIREDDTPRQPLVEEITQEVRGILSLRTEQGGAPALPKPLVRAACTTIMRSIKNHSVCRPGEVQYLRFVDEFIV